MKKLIIKFIFLIFIFKNVYSVDKDELFSDKSIIRKLRNDLGTFKTEASFKLGEGFGKSVNEQYDFKLKNGKVSIPNENYIWINNFEEYYNFNENECNTYFNDEIMNLILNNWLPITYKKIPFKSKMLGPSHLLFILIDHYDENKNNIKCEDIENNKMIKCDISFENKIKIEYYFNNKDDLKMYPLQIKTYLEVDQELRLYNDINYIKFEYSFNSDDYKIDLRLPIGVGCVRIGDRTNKKYPNLENDGVDKQFKLEYDAELSYLDLNIKDKDVFLKTEFKQEKLFMDTEFRFLIVNGIIEEKNRNVTTYYDDAIHLAYDIFDNRCIKYNLKDGNEPAWIMKFYNIKSFFDFFFAYRKYGISYLGDYNLDNKIHRVFEKKVHNFFITKKGKHDRNFYERLPFYSIITHYYSESNKKVPTLVEIRTRNLYGKLLGFLKIKINKYNLALSSDSFNEKIDFDQCFQNLKSEFDYKELNVAFNGNSKLFNDNYIKYEFRKLIDKNSDKSFSFLSPLRIHDIKLEKTNNLINITAKLLEPIDFMKYFSKTQDLTLDESDEKSENEEVKIIENVGDEESCSRLCIQMQYCAAYSYSRNSICKLWIDLEFNGDIDNRDGYDWLKLKTKKEDDTILAKRMNRFYMREHLPTNYTFNLIDGLIKKKDFNLVLKRKDNDKGIIFNYIKEPISNNDDSLKRYIPHFILSIVIIFIILLLLR